MTTPDTSFDSVDMVDDGPEPVAPDADTAGSVESFLAEVATRVHSLVPSALGATVTLQGPPPRTGGASTDAAARVDAAQYEVGAGPCLHTLSSGEELYAPDLTAELRWGDYGRRAAAIGARASFSVPVKDGGSTIAVLKLYGREVDPFGESVRSAARTASSEVAGGLLLARQLLAESTTAADLRAAMGTRRVIDLALGVLMARSGVGPDQAFALLTRASQDRNIKLNVLAAQLVESVTGAEPVAEAPFTARDAAPPGRR